MLKENLIDKNSTTHKIFNIAVIVAALGYFVDIYDLILYLLVRNPSLKDIGVPPEQLKEIGIHLFNYQMVGMLCGGIVWGILGDKKGRMTALFLTILIYSLANIANGFVQTVEQYKWLRFIAGFGLAGIADDMHQAAETRNCPPARMDCRVPQRLNWVHVEGRKKTTLCDH